MEAIQINILRLLGKITVLERNMLLLGTPTCSYKI